MPELGPDNIDQPLSSKEIEQHAANLRDRVQKVALNSPSYKNALAAKLMEEGGDLPSFPEVIFPEGDELYGITYATKEQGIVMVRKKSLGKDEFPHSYVGKYPHWDEEFVIQTKEGSGIQYRNDFSIGSKPIVNGVKAVEAANRMVGKLEDIVFPRRQEIR